MDVIVVDDLKSLPDATVCRTSDSGLSTLVKRWTVQMRSQFAPSVDELWLDNDLGYGDTTRPIVDWLMTVAAIGQPLRVGTVWVHTENYARRPVIIATLERAGYNVRSGHLSIVN